MELFYIELLSQMAGTCVYLQQLKAGKRAAEMDKECYITGKCVLKCTGCNLQVCLEMKTCNSEILL